MSQPWKIEINNPSLGGFAPTWYKETYPSYGGINQAGAMQNMDLTNSGFITQGPGLANLTNGTQAAAVTTLLKGIADFAVTAGVTYGVGGAKLYQMGTAAVTNAGDFPHTINKAVVTDEDGEDVTRYKGALYYSYNHSGSAGDIGKFDLTSTFDDDWGSTVPTGAAALTSNPHQMVVGDDVLYIANGRYVATYDGTTLDTQALDLAVDSQIQSIAWFSGRLWIAANRPPLSNVYKTEASVYVWDGVSESWELEIPMFGSVGALHVRGGQTIYVFYADASSTGGYKVGAVEGGAIRDVAHFTGALPAYYQVTEFKDFLLWGSIDDSAGLLWAVGPLGGETPLRTFQIADGGYAKVGAVACPLGTPYIASWDDGTNYRLAKFSGYDTACSWKSLVFDVTGEGRSAKLTTMRFNFEQLAASARVDWSLVNNQGKTLLSGIISHTKLGAVTTFWDNSNFNLENFRLQLDFSSGNTTNAVKIKNVKFYGHTE